MSVRGGVEVDARDVALQVLSSSNCGTLTVNASPTQRGPATAQLTPGHTTYRRAIGTIFGLPFFATNPLRRASLQTLVCTERHVGGGVVASERR